MSTSELATKEMKAPVLESDVFTREDEISSVGHEALKRIDFPTRKTEAWKYTRVQRIAKKKYVSGESASVTNEHADITLINGKVLSTGALESNGIRVRNISELSQEERTGLAEKLESRENIFAAMNFAGYTDGFVIDTQKSAEHEGAIRIVHYTHGADALSQPLYAIQAAENSSLNLIFEYRTLEGSGCLTNPYMHIDVAPSARVHMDIAQLESEENDHVQTIVAHQHASSVLQVNVYCLGNKLLRNTFYGDLDASYTETHLYGLYLPLDGQHVDNQTILDHRMPNCESNEQYKGIMKGKSTGVFNGKVFVRKDAQKTNAYQNNANLVLDDEAEINSKPELEIYADDVKCSHGSTTGQLDEEQLFYLRARGIGKQEAVALLVRAFCGEIIDQCKDPSLRDELTNLVSERYS